MIDERIVRDIGWYSRRVEAQLSAHYSLTIAELSLDAQAFLLEKRREAFDYVPDSFFNAIWPNGLAGSVNERREQLEEHADRLSEDMLTLMRGILDAEEKAEIRRLDKKFEGQVDP